MLQSRQGGGCPDAPKTIAPGGRGLAGCLGASPLANVTSIGDSAFSNCGNLITLKIPSSVVSIGPSAFYTSGLTEIGIPDGVTNLGAWAFGFCSSLTNAMIGAGITTIADSTFQFCRNLSVVAIPNGVTSIGTQAFGSCSSLGNVVIPDHVTNIGDFAFLGCSSLGGVVIPGSVTNIGNSAFSACGSLTNLTLGGAGATIGQNAFSSCTLLTKVNIPDGIASIGFGAFGSCTGLTNAVVAASVTNIDSLAFGLGRLGSFSIYFLGNPPKTDTSAVMEATVYYLPGATGWSNTIWWTTAFLWNPVAQAPSVRNDQFGFDIAGTASIPIVVEASTNLAGDLWTPLQNATLTNGLIRFSDPAWTNSPTRCYRLRSP